MKKLFAVAAIAVVLSISGNATTLPSVEWVVQ